MNDVNTKRNLRAILLATIVLTMALLPTVFFPGRLVNAAPPVYDVNDDFNGPNLNTSIWTVTKEGNPAFGYTVGPWSGMGGENSLYCSPITGGNPSSYNGYFFTHTLSIPCQENYTVETEIAWKASNQFPIFGVYLLLLNSSGGTIVQVGYYDAWAFSSAHKYAYIEGTSPTIGSELPLSGRAALKVERNGDQGPNGNQVKIYWGGGLLKTGTSFSTVAKIQLLIRGHSSYQNGGGGFNYLRARGVHSNAIHDDFNGPVLTSLWQVTKEGAPQFSYQIGGWFEQGGSWLKCQQMTGGTPYGYVGYQFTHYLTGYPSCFNIQTRLAWRAAGTSSIYMVYLLLLDGNGVPKVQVGYYDAWSGSSGRKYAMIEGNATQVPGLSLSGEAAIVISRNPTNLVRIYWDGNLLFQNYSASTIARIQLQIRGHTDLGWQGGSGGFDYLYANPNTPESLTVVEDCHVDQQDASLVNNYEELSLQNMTSHSHWVYLKFDLRGVRDLVSAHLQLYVNAASPAPAVARCYAHSNTSWSEYTLSWNTRPSNGGYLQQFLGERSGQPGTWIDWDVTSYVRSHENSTMTFILTTTNGLSSKYASREYNTTAWNYCARLDTVGNYPVETKSCDIVKRYLFIPIFVLYDPDWCPTNYQMLKTTTSSNFQFAFTVKGEATCFGTLVKAEAGVRVKWGFQVSQYYNTSKADTGRDGDLIYGLLFDYVTFHADSYRRLGQVGWNSTYTTYTLTGLTFLGYLQIFRKDLPLIGMSPNAIPDMRGYRGSVRDPATGFYFLGPHTRAWVDTEHHFGVGGWLSVGAGFQIDDPWTESGIKLEISFKFEADWEFKWGTSFEIYNPFDYPAGYALNSYSVLDRVTEKVNIYQYPISWFDYGVLPP